jgi:hypothetical protein
MKPRLLFGIVVLVLLATVFWLFTRGHQSATTTLHTVEPAMAARFREVQGPVLVLRGNALFHAAVGIALEPGDLVQTGVTGTADILWPGYGHSLVGNSSGLRIEDEQPSPFVGKLSLEAGRIWTRLQKLLGRDEAYEVRISNVSAAVRGTSFGIDRNGDLVRVQVTESKVGVSRVASPTNETVVTAGQEVQTSVADGTDQSPIGTTTQLNVQDPFIKAGDVSLSDAELNATGSHAVSLSGTPNTISAIVSEGHVIPLDQLHTHEAEPQGCPGEHYHANNGFVTALDGAILYDPGHCGFGIVSEHPTLNVKIY